MQAPFHDLLVAHLPRLRVLAYSIAKDRSRADDLVQEAVAKALAAAHQFTPGTQFGAWMYRIMRNQFLSDLRKRGPMVEVGEDDNLENRVVTPGGHDACVMMGELRAGMRNLPTAQREALLLIAVDGMSYDEAAEALNCSPGTVKSRVSRARQALKDHLLGEEMDAEHAPEHLAAQRAGHRRAEKQAAYEHRAH